MLKNLTYVVAAISIITAPLASYAGIDTLYVGYDRPSLNKFYIDVFTSDFASHSNLLNNYDSSPFSDLGNLTGLVYAKDPYGIDSLYLASQYVITNINSVSKLTNYALLNSGYIQKVWSTQAGFVEFRRSALVTDITADGEYVYTVRTGTLNDISETSMRDGVLVGRFTTGLSLASGIVAAENDLYIAAGNGIYRYSTAGNLLDSFTLLDNSISFSDITYASGSIYATFFGGQNGVSVLQALDLTESSSFLTVLNATGIASGSNNDLFITVGNGIYRYDRNGTLLNQFISSDTSVIFKDVAVRTDVLTVPEPENYAMFMVGLGLVALAPRSRKVKVK